MGHRFWVPLQDAGAQTWDQYLDKVRRGEIWGGACEVGRWAQSKGCRVAMYQEWGPQGVYRKMAEVGEGKRTAAALLWSRREGGHYELLWPPGEGDTEAVAEADEEDGTESKGDAEVTIEEELAKEGPEKEGGGERERREEHMWRGVHQIPIKKGGERWRYQGQECPGRERRGMGGGYSARQETTSGMGRGARSASTGDGIYGSARGYGERRVAQEAGRGGGRVGHRGGGGGVAAAAQGGCGDRVGGRESGPDTTGQSGVAGAGMEEGTGWRRGDAGGGVGI